MNKAINRLLENKGANHLLPFFWQHGEDEATLREYVGAIQEAGCGAFCVESRPHPDFCGPLWWRDMGIILDEATKRGMGVWILDDSHFPTGYANGTLKDAPPELCRQSVTCRTLSFSGGEKLVKFDLEKLSHPPKYKMPFISKVMTMMAGKQRRYNDDAVYSVTAYGPGGEAVDLSGKVEWRKPAGNWEVRVSALSRNCGPHRSYINMMSAASCKKLLDACYEPHYQRYGDLFGTTIQGFFSDEPELGNGILYAQGNTLGTEQDLPWSRELETLLDERTDGKHKNLLPLLWKNDFDPVKTGAFRRLYMDAVSELVSKDFSKQLGDWCKAHNVRYIGHLNEDNDCHTRTAAGLGHFFRGEAGQHMAGIDDIGGQVLPQGEDEPTKGLLGLRNGGFFHYTLGKLGVSAAYLDPKKRGVTMCELFGNYGWKLGVTDMKYLADHFLVRGVNCFVPHAFSPKAYPDSDCPPHFYAHGNNPQYRAVGELFRYMNRVSELISDGRPVIKTAILYNAEAEWMGAAETLDKTARVLYDNQIDFIFLPLDEVERAAEFIAVLITPADRQDARIANIPNAVFVDRLPEVFVGGEVDASALKVVKKADLVTYLREKGAGDARITPENAALHVLHYQNGGDIYLVNNEGAATWRGTVTLPVAGSCYAWNAWENRLERLNSMEKNGKTVIDAVVEPRKLFTVVFDTELPECLSAPLTEIPSEEICAIAVMERSICKAADYPRFQDAKLVSIPDGLEKELPKFSGFVRYESTFDWDGGGSVLEIDEPCEAVEVFVNGISAGTQIVPTYRFDLSALVRPGKNQLRIEIATTLERENVPTGPVRKAVAGGNPTSKSGLAGTVRLLRT